MAVPRFALRASHGKIGQYIKLGDLLFVEDPGIEYLIHVR